MGREIRRVPPHWEHPKTERDFGCGLSYQPMHNEEYAQAVATWKADFEAWERGERPSYFDASEYPNGCEFWEWENPPPERAYYLTYDAVEATWFQMYETVSEGTPVTPPFETKEELIDYLVEHGTFWDQQRAVEGRMRAADVRWRPEAARAFVESGWAPSMMVVSSPAGAKIYTAKEGFPTPDPDDSPTSGDQTPSAAAGMGAE